MIINKEFLKSLEPCKGRWTNYLTHYSNWSGTPLQFVELDLISNEDKFWVLLREEVIPSKELHLLACDFAESVLHIYETAYPQDFRPRDVITAKKQWIKGEITDNDLEAASEAARAASLATSEAARAVSKAASEAASEAARAASLATSEAARAASEAASRAASRASYWAAEAASRAAYGAAARDAEQNKQLEKIKEVLKTIEQTAITSL